MQRAVRRGRRLNDASAWQLGGAAQGVLGNLTDLLRDRSEIPNASYEVGVP